MLRVLVPESLRRCCTAAPCPRRALAVFRSMVNAFVLAALLAPVTYVRALAGMSPAQEISCIARRRRLLRRRFCEVTYLDTEAVLTLNPPGGCGGNPPGGGGGGGFHDRVIIACDDSEDDDDDDDDWGEEWPGNPNTSTLELRQIITCTHTAYTKPRGL